MVLLRFLAFFDVTFVCCTVLLAITLYAAFVFLFNNFCSMASMLCFAVPALLSDVTGVLLSPDGFVSPVPGFSVEGCSGFGSLAIFSVFVSLQPLCLHLYVRIPSSVTLGCLVTVPSSHSCPSAGNFFCLLFITVFA